MRNFYVTRDKRSWRYRENLTASWSFFDDSVVDSKTMQAFFMRGNHDPVSLSFTDETGKPAKIIEAKRGNGKINITINAGERCPELKETDFIPENEQIKFFSGKQTDEVNMEALKLQPYYAVKYYKKMADLETSDEFRDLVKEKMSNEGVVNLLKEREGQAEIFFIE